MATELKPVTDLAARYREVRAATERLCAPLEVEDYVVQSMPDTSPTKWHLAHVSWFFETLVLQPHLPDYESSDPRYAFLFNSYYNSLGAQFSRPDRGLVTRPTVADVHAYRQHVDAGMEALFDRCQSLGVDVPEVVIEIGLHHEQQHQELILTDVKHLLSRNPLRPAYSGASGASGDSGDSGELAWTHVHEGVYEIGSDYGHGFVYDNETPRHKVYIHEFELANRLVTNGEYKAFIEDGGYERAEFWLSNGWATVNAEGWTAPLYWERQEGTWHHFTLAGFRPVDDDEPVCHVSLYEADAYASWAGARLPTEVEWEVVASQQPVAGNLVESARYHPRPVGAASPAECRQLFGDVWEWTSSAYTAYPGYERPKGALGEYNAKFMSGQNVLRGGSCATPVSHIRPTYRNFFYAPDRWQFTGLRLAR